MDRKRARAALRVDAPNGPDAAAPERAAARRTCPVCGYQWEGRGAGVAGDACPMLGCTGRV
jgi:hypothetical protein